MILQQVGGKATRDVLFLSSFPATDLPKAVLATALLCIPAALGVSNLLARWGPRRVVPATFLLNSGLFLFEFWLTLNRAAWTPWMVFLHVGVLGSVTISSFWSVVNERFDPHTARRVIGRIGAGATLGGLAGGLISERVGSLFGAQPMLLVLCFVNLIASFSIWFICLERTAAEASEPANFKTLVTSPYLSKIALIVALTAVTAAVIDYAMKAQAAAQFSEESSLMSFFAIFYTAASVLTFVLQTAFATKLLERLGIGGTLALLPAMVALVGTLGAALHRMWTVVLLRGLETVLSNSFFRSAYELLYTPLPANQKRSFKTIIDVALDRLGDILGSGIVLAALLLPAYSGSLLISIAVVIALVSAYLSFRLHQGYISELATSLRSGAVQLREADVFDATTRYTLSQTANALDREKLLDQIAELRARREQAAAIDRQQSESAAPSKPVSATAPTDAGAFVPASTLNGATGQPSADAKALEAGSGNIPEATADADQPIVLPPPKTLPSYDGSGTEPPSLFPVPSEEAAPSSVYPPDPEGSIRLRAQLADLLSDEPKRVRAALASNLDARSAPILIDLLARDEYARDATRALEALGARITGQLVDALLDKQTRFSARRRLPHVLRHSPSGLAVRGLTGALEDERFEVRYRAGRALLHLAERPAPIMPPRKLILDAVLQELDVPADHWNKHRLAMDPKSADDSSADPVEALRSDRRLQHVFTLLSLVIDTQAIQLSLKALASRDEKLRGTALEYLENVVPENVKARLWPHLEGEQRPAAGQRTPSELLDELKTSVTNLDVSALRESTKS